MRLAQYLEELPGHVIRGWRRCQPAGQVDAKRKVSMSRVGQLQLATYAFSGLRLITRDVGSDLTRLVGSGISGVFIDCSRHVVCVLMNLINVTNAWLVVVG